MEGSDFGDGSRVVRMKRTDGGDERRVVGSKEG